MMAMALLGRGDGNGTAGWAGAMELATAVTVHKE